MSPPQPTSVESIGDSLVDRCRSLLPGAGRQEIENLQRDFGSYFQELSRAAHQTSGQIYSGRWTMLGHDYDLRKPYDWHADPRSGHRWERKFFKDVSLSVPGCDVKYVWEPNRHQYLAELGRHWLLNADQHAAHLAMDHLEDWIDENPLYEGVNWTSALEPAMRIISWAWTIPSTAESFMQQRNGLLDQVAQSLADHATYLEHHLSYYSSPFNHLIGEATGLYLVSYLLHDHPDSPRWRKLSRSVLCDHSERQFYADGMTVEQAMGYHFYTLGFLVMAIQIARIERCPMRHVEEVVHRAFRAGIAFRRPDGTWPPIGDLDNARSIPCHPQDYWNFGSLCSLAAVMFDDAALIVDDAPGQELYWLLGTDGIRRWHEFPKKTSPRVPNSSDAKPHQHFVLPHSGYAIARRDESWFLFDVGPIAEGLFEDSTPSTAHGHADTLQVLYSRSGECLLRDAGINSYAARQHADFVRSAEAHNTVVIDGVRVARHAGQLAWSNAAPAPEMRYCIGDDVWLARGHLAFNPQVSISRSVLGFPDDGLWIADLISTDRKRKVSWYWQLKASDLVEEKRQNDLAWRLDAENIIRSYRPGSARSASFDEASNNSDIGWYFPGYGERRPGGRLSFHEPCDGKLFVLTFVGRESSDWAIEHVHSEGLVVNCITSERDNCELHREEGQISWTVRNGSERRTYVCGLERTPIDPGWTEVVSHEGNWPCATKAIRL